MRVILILIIVILVVVIILILCRFIQNLIDLRKNQDIKEQIEQRLGRSVGEINKYEIVIANDAVHPNHIDLSSGSICGHENIKQSILEHINPPPIICGDNLISLQKGVLLYGPPGNGKTMLAKVITKESGAVLINLRVSNIKSNCLDDAHKYVGAVFTLACKLKPSIIFIDEVDSFLGQGRSSEDVAISNMKTEFLSNWDRLTTNQNVRVMVLAATSRINDIDKAIRRRFYKEFYMGMPNESERVELLKFILKDKSNEGAINYKYLTTLCEGFSASELSEICKQASYFHIGDGNVGHAARKLSQTDLENALKMAKQAKNEMRKNYV